MPSRFGSLLASGRPIVGDGATGTRLQFESPLSVDDTLGLVGLVDDPGGADAIRAVVAGYAATATELGLPVVVDAPTWWARPDRLGASGLTGATAVARVRRCATLLHDLRDKYPGMYVCAPLGPFTDGYRSGQIDTGNAGAFHQWQVDAIAPTGVDVVLAATFSTTTDLHMAARVLATSGLDYVLGPTVNTAGCLPDGQFLGDAIDTIESDISRAPLHWALCCVHPTIAGAALDQLADRNWAAHQRVRQVKGNASAASAHTRDRTRSVLADDPEPWAQATIDLRHRHGLQILGGCYGTDHRHFLSVALRLTSAPPATGQPAPN